MVSTLMDFHNARNQTTGKVVDMDTDSPDSWRPQLMVGDEGDRETLLKPLFPLRIQTLPRRTLPPSHTGYRPDPHCIGDCSREATVPRNPCSEHKKQTTEIKPGGHQPLER